MRNVKIFAQITETLDSKYGSGPPRSHVVSAVAVTTPRVG
jgi:hypothetical protein